MSRARSRGGGPSGPAAEPPRAEDLSRARLDAELVRRGLAPSRERAQADIEAGRVVVDGAPARKAAQRVGAASDVVLVGDAPRFVGRGGEKLDAALDRFGIDVAHRRAIDVGASTGGFTDCLLQRGAREVVALDVGHDQLAPSLRADDRVVVREGTNVRHVTPADVGGPFDVVVADLSFISLRTVAGVLAALTAADGDLVVLVKPQFEAGPADTRRGDGVVRDPGVWRRVLGEVRDAFVGQDAVMIGAMVSPLRGSRGNVEFLAHLRHGTASDTAVDLDVLVEGA